NQPLPIQPAGNMLALIMRCESTEIDPDQIGGQAIDGGLISAVPGTAAVNFRLIITREKPFAAQPIGREIPFKEAPRVFLGLSADFLPVAHGSGVAAHGVGRRLAGNDATAAAKSGKRRP